MEILPDGQNKLTFAYRPRNDYCMNNADNTNNMPGMHDAPKRCDDKKWTRNAWGYMYEYNSAQAAMGNSFLGKFAPIAPFFASFLIVTSKDGSIKGNYNVYAMYDKLPRIVDKHGKVIQVETAILKAICI